MFLVYVHNIDRKINTREHREEEIGFTFNPSTISLYVRIAGKGKKLALRRTDIHDG